MDSYPNVHVSFEMNDSYQLVFALFTWGTDLTIFFCLFFKTIKVTLQTNKTDLIILAVCGLPVWNIYILHLLPLSHASKPCAASLMLCIKILLVNCCDALLLLPMLAWTNQWTSFRSHVANRTIKLTLLQTKKLFLPNFLGKYLWYSPPPYPPTLLFRRLNICIYYTTFLNSSLVHIHIFRYFISMLTFCLYYVMCMRL